MRKSVFSFSKLILAVTLAVATMSTVFVGCKNYDDDIKNLQDKIDAVSKSVTDLAAKVAEIKQPITDAVSVDGGKGIKFTLKDGSTVTLTNQSVAPVVIPEYTMKVSADGKSVELLKDGVKVSTVNFPATPDFSKVTVSADGELLIDGEKTGIFVNSGTFMVKGKDFITISMPNKDGVIETANIPFYNAAGAVSAIYVYDNEYAVSYFQSAETLWGGPKAVVATEGPNKDKKVMQAGLRAGLGTPVLVMINPANADITKLPMPAAYDSKKGLANLIFSAPKAFDGYLTRTADNKGLWQYTTQLEVALNAKEADVKANLYAKSTAPVQQKAFAVNYGTEIQSPYDLVVDLYKGAAPLTAAYASQVTYINEALEVKPTFTGTVVYTDVLGAVVATPALSVKSEDFIFDQYIVCTNQALFEQYGIKIEGMKITATKGVGTTTAPVPFTYNVITLDGTIAAPVAFTVTFKENLGQLDATLDKINLQVPFGAYEAAAKRTAYTSLTPMWDKIKAAGVVGTWPTRVATKDISVSSVGVGVAVTYVMGLYEKDPAGTATLATALGLVCADFTKADVVKTSLETLWKNQITLDYGVYDRATKVFTPKAAAADWKDIQAVAAFNLLMPEALPYTITVSFKDADGIVVNKVTFDYTIELASPAFIKVPARWIGEKVIAYGNPVLYAGYITYPFSNAVTNLVQASDLYKESVPEGKAPIFVGSGFNLLDGKQTAVLDLAGTKPIILIKTDSLEVTRTLSTDRQYAVGFNAFLPTYGAFTKNAQSFELEARSPIFDGSVKVADSISTISYKHNTVTELYVLPAAFTAVSMYGGNYSFLTPANFNDGIQAFNQIPGAYSVKSTGANATLFTASIVASVAQGSVTIPAGKANGGALTTPAIKIVPTPGEVINGDTVVPIEISFKDAWGKANKVTINVTVKK